MRPGNRRPACCAAVLAVALLLAAAVGPMAPAAAHSYRLGDIAIGHVWAPPPAPGVDEVMVYGPFLNLGTVPVRLQGASSPVAVQAELEVTEQGAGRRLDAVTLSPGVPQALASWQAHIRLTGLKRDLKAGDSFDLVLDFGPAGSVDVEVLVEAQGGH